MPTDTFFLYLGFSLSLQSTSFVSSLYFERVQFSERARTPVNGRSRAGILVDLFRFQFDFLSFDTNAMARFSSWRRDSILCPSERMKKRVVHSSPRPQCLGYFARLLVLLQNTFLYWNNRSQIGTNSLTLSTT